MTNVVTTNYNVFVFEVIVNGIQNLVCNQNTSKVRHILVYKLIDVIGIKIEIEQHVSENTIFCYV